MSKERTALLAVSVSRLFSIGITAVQLPAMARLTEPKDFAILVSCMAVATYLAWLFVEPETLAFRRFPGTQEEASSYVFAYSRSLKRTLAVLALIVVAATLASLFAQGVAALCWALGLAAGRITSTAWLSWQRPWRYAVNLALGSSARAVVLIGVLATTEMSPPYALALSGLAAAMVYWALGPVPGAVLSFHSASRPTQWPIGLGLSLAMASLGATLLSNVDKVLSPVLLEPGAAGSYSAMTQLAVLLIGTAIGVVNTATYPTALAAWHASVEKGDLYLRHLVATLASLTCAVIGLLHLASPWAVPLLFGPNYLEQNILGAVLCAGALQALGLIQVWHSEFRLRSSYMKSIAMVAGVVAVPSCAMGAWTAGPSGLALGLLLPSAFYYLTVGGRSAARPLHSALGTGIFTSGALHAFGESALANGLLFALGMSGLGLVFIGVVRRRLVL